MPNKKSRSWSIKARNFVLMSFNFEKECSANAVETEIVSRAVARLSTVGGSKEGAIENFLILRKIC